MARTRPQFCMSRGELAAVLGRHERTMHVWSAQGMPGVEGRYDVAKCAGWAFCQGLLRFEQTTPESKNESPKDRLDRLKGDEKQIDVARLRESIVDVEPVRRMVTRLILEAKAVLDQLADRIPAELPQEISAGARSRARELILATLDDAYLILSQMDRFTDEEGTETA